MMRLSKRHIIKISARDYSQQRFNFFGQNAESQNIANDIFGYLSQNINLLSSTIQKNNITLAQGLFSALIADIRKLLTKYNELRTRKTHRDLDDVLRQVRKFRNMTYHSIEKVEDSKMKQVLANAAGKIDELIKSTKSLYRDQYAEDKEKSEIQETQKYGYAITNHGLEEFNKYFSGKFGRMDKQRLFDFLNSKYKLQTRVPNTDAEVLINIGDGMVVVFEDRKVVTFKHANQGIRETQHLLEY